MRAGPRGVGWCGEQVGAGGSCLDPSYRNMTAFLSNVTSDGESGGRQWTWQTCNEFAYFQSCDDAPCMFSKLETLQFYLDLCQSVYGVSAATVAANVAATNLYYGSVNL